MYLYYCNRRLRRYPRDKIIHYPVVTFCTGGPTGTPCGSVEVRLEGVAVLEVGQVVVVEVQLGVVVDYELYS